MKSNPFKEALAKLLLCTNCKKNVANPEVGLCRRCEISSLHRDQIKEDK